MDESGSRGGTPAGGGGAGLGAVPVLGPVPVPGTPAGSFRGPSAPGGRGFPGRFPGLITRRFLEHGGFQAASALTLKTLLALIPVMVVASVLLKGVFPDFEEPVRSFVFQKLSAQAQTDLKGTLDRFFVRFRTESPLVGVAAFIFLAWSAISLLTTAEDLLNRIFGAPKGRGFFARFANYWAVLTLGPALLGVAITLLAMRDPKALAAVGIGNPFLQKLYPILAPLILVVLAFFALYFLLPNARVHAGWAMLGAIFAAILWYGLIFANDLYLRYFLPQEPVYGLVMLFPVSIVAIYSANAILLAGAEVAAGAQYRGSRIGAAAWSDLSPAARVYWSLAILREFGRAFREGAGPLSAGQAARRLGLSPSVAQESLRQFVRMGILSEAGNSDPRYLPTRPLDRISISEVLDALDPPPQHLGEADPVSEVFRKARLAAHEALRSMTLEDLARKGRPPGRGGPGKDKVPNSKLQRISSDASVDCSMSNGLPAPKPSTRKMAPVNRYMVVLSDRDFGLIRDRDLYFGASWDRMRVALLREMEGKPFAENQLRNCGDLLRRIQDLEAIEESEGVDLHDHLPESRPDHS